MKIAVFCAYFYPHEGGMEKYVQKLFSELKNVDVTIITSNSENVKSFEKKFGMDIYRFKCHNFMNNTYPVITLSEYKKIKKLCSDKTFDYIITQTRFFNTSLLGCKIAKDLGVKLIHFEHGTKHSPIKNPILNMFGKFYDHTIGKYIIKNSWKTVGISEASCDFIKHLYKKSRPELIYNCIDMDALKKTGVKEQDRLRKELHILTNENVVMFLGRVIYAKGVQDLLDATKDLKNVKIIIVGDGNYLKELKKKYPRAIYVGEQKNVVKYLSIADIFVNPSYAEGLPTSVLEAGAVGIACIATDVGGTREIIDDKINGNLIKTKDVQGLKLSISRLLNDNKLRKKYSDKLKYKIQHNFTWKINREKLESVLKP